MDSERLARLTEQQRICLRLVFAHMTSKEIAPHLGIEPGSVDQHIKAAMRVLGVGDRRTAARVLAEQEGAARASAGVAMHEDPLSYDPSPPLREPILPLPWEGLRPTHVGWVKRLAWIIGIAIGIAFAFGALVAGAEALTRIIWG